MGNIWRNSEWPYTTSDLNDCFRKLTFMKIVIIHLVTTRGEGRVVGGGTLALQRRHNGSNGVSNHWRLDCSFKRLFRRRSKKISKLRFTSLNEWNQPVISEFPTQSASNSENVSIWWCHHGIADLPSVCTKLSVMNSCPRVSNRPYHLQGDVVIMRSIFSLILTINTP